MGQNKILGALGENLACKYLEDTGYSIIERNFSCRAGEIDIIAFEGETIVFIEVKTRVSEAFGMPSEAVSAAKQKKLVKAALYYMQKKQLFNYMSRFDVIEIIMNGESDCQVNIIKDAFQYSGKYGY